MKPATACSWMTARRGLGVVVVFSLSVACEAPGRPKLEQEASETTNFAELFNQNCSGCHGENGKNGPARPINDPLYLALVPKETLRGIVVNGRPGTSMPAWAQKQGGPLSEPQITALVDGIEANWSRRVETHGRPLPPYEATEEKGDAANGKKLYLRACFACHAKGGLVGPVTEPAYLALASDQGLRASIITGRADLGMPNYQVLNAGRALSSQDVTDLVAYLASLRGGK
jgi:cytochrome c oxidase cbb3-type subunit 3